ncbi:CoA-dependent acyltransferase [Clavulina sp. PMI_390]|nr:CoA-dependent acyltransferase [Clavulina sp. PMI_390]
MIRRIGFVTARRFVRKVPLRLLSTSPVWRGKSLRPFLLADIGEGITECEVLKWSVEPNATVSMFDPLCEVQSDKASVEITSPFDGIVKELLVQEGDIAKVGQGLCVIEVEDTEAVENDPNVGAPVETTPASEETPSSPAPVVPPPVTTTPTSTDAPARPRRPHPLDPSQPRSSSEGSQFPPAEGSLALPAVRHFARKNYIDDLSLLMPGSGKEGRIEMKDVEAYLAKQSAPSTSSAATEAATTASNVVPAATQEIEMGRTRLAMYKAMTKSLEIPHFGYSATLDLTALDALLPTFNAHIPQSFNPPPPAKFAAPISPHSIFTNPPAAPTSDPTKQYTRLTVLPLLMKALSRAMLEWPVFRTTITPSSADSGKPTLTLRPGADISVGMSTPTGLYSPTIQGVEKMNAYEIMGELRRLQTLGRQVPSGLTTKEMPRAGGTITVSNVGAIGKGEWAHPLLVPGGGVAIVAIGRAKWVMKELESQPGVQQRRLEVNVSWSADHRVIEGAEMAAFVETWRSWVEQPGRLIADGR